MITKRPGRKPRYMSAADRTAIRKQTKRLRELQAGVSVLETRIKEERERLARFLNGEDS